MALTDRSAAAASTPHVDVLIVNYRSASLTELAATSVQAPTHHIFVADNSGEFADAGSSSWAREVIVNPRNLLYAAANNQLYRLCDGEFVLLLNPDVEFSTYGVSRLVEALRERSDAWGAVPKLLNLDGTPQNYYRRLPTLPAMLADRMPPLRRVFRRAWQRHLYTDLDMNTPGVVQAPPGACLLLRRSSVGERLFDDRYPLFHQDADLARRMNPGGVCVYVPAATATHIKGASLSEERKHRPLAIAASYDRSALLYAKENLRGYWLVVLVVWARRLLTIVLQPILERRRDRVR